MRTRSERPSEIKSHIVDKKHRGAHSELSAVLYFLERGYEVFRNVSAHGPADLIIWNPETGEMRKLDIKTASMYTKLDGSQVPHHAFSKVPDIETVAVVDGSVLEFT
jgi:hypothetical protein